LCDGGIHVGSPIIISDIRAPMQRNANASPSIYGRAGRNERKSGESKKSERFRKHGSLKRREESRWCISSRIEMLMND
jgi:hypothetical protein